MKNKNIKFYKLDESKSTITFNNFINKKKISKAYKSIIRNSFVLSFVFVIAVGVFGMYVNKKVSELAAAVYNTQNQKDETMNNSSNTLKIVNINYNEKYEVIINKANPLNDDMISLYKQVEVENNVYPNIKIEQATYNNYLNLKQAIEKRGYYLNIRSGFRSLEESQNIYNKYASEKGISYAEKYVAKPGVSEHNAGIAFDVVISKDLTNLTNDYQSDEYKYLENIAYLYGFIIRYPKDKEQITGYEYEPWHLRYVGKNLAKYLTKNNLTLEEYYDEKEKLILLFLI